MSNRALGKKAGVGTSFVSDLKNLEKNPSADNVLKLARALDLSVVWLFTGVEMTPELEEVLAIYAALPRSGRSALMSVLRELRASESA